MGGRAGGPGASVPVYPLPTLGSLWPQSPWGELVDTGLLADKARRGGCHGHLAPHRALGWPGWLHTRRSLPGGLTRAVTAKEAQPQGRIL